MADFKIDVPEDFVETLKKDMDELRAIPEVEAFLVMGTIHTSIQNGEMVSDEETDVFIRLITNKCMDLKISPIFRFMAISYVLRYRRLDGEPIDNPVKECTCNCDNA